MVNASDGENAFSAWVCWRCQNRLEQDRRRRELLRQPVGQHQNLLPPPHLPN